MPDWSPDGRFIAYISMRGADQSYGVLCIRDMESGTERDVQSDTGPVAHPRWSPDGRYVFARGYSQGRATLLRIDVQSGKSTLVLRESALNYAPSPFELAADGKSFYYQPASLKGFSNLGSPIVRHDMESGAETRIHPATNSWMAPWAPSPDGKSIAFRGAWGKRSFDETFDLNVISTSGGEPRVLLKASGVNPRSALAWTRDGRYVLFAKRLGPGAKVSLLRVPASGGEPESLGLEMEAIGDLRVSPNGRQLAFIAGRPNNKLQVWIMENFLPAKQSAAREAGAEERPGEKSEASSRKSSEPSAAKAAGLTLRKLTEGGTTYGNSHPSPDGRYILMPWQNSMALLDVTTGEQREFGPNLD
ncbi:MAG: PD40 domain-containing protein, partial [Verrucomicrobia bacterium]|nr:PD40 domain-containing protein [Verrucomicrobiota bacterium]